MIKHLIRGTLGAAAVILAIAPAHAATILVTPETLKSAFAAANAGDTLKLVGTFGNVKLQNQNFSSVVTLDAQHAIFTDTVILQNDSNVTLWRGQYNIAGGSSYNAAVDVYGGSNIVVDRANVAGNSSEVGINVEGTTNATVTNSYFDGLHAAISLGSVTGGTASYNRITHATTDGIDIGDSHNVLASFNSCTLGTPLAPSHPDCIQLWSIAGNPLQSDITVTRNTAIGPTQGFTSFGTGGGELRVTMTWNTVSTLFPQGVACYDCIDSNISYNKISTLPGAQYQTGLSIVGGSDNTVVGNTIGAKPVVVTPALAGIANFRFDAARLDSSPAGVPEPATWAMLVAGFAAVGLARRRGTGGATARSAA